MKKVDCYSILVYIFFNGTFIIVFVFLRTLNGWGFLKKQMDECGGM